MTNLIRMMRLRADAEAALSRGAGRGFGIEYNSDSELQNKIHSLDVYRTELELQNEELRRSQQDLEEARDRYADLYDFAPLGYFTLDENGKIVEANLTGAIILAANRSVLISRLMSSFIINQDIARFMDHIIETFTSGSRRVCEIGMVKTDGARLYARLESIAVPVKDGSERLVRTAVADITERRLAEEALRTLSLAVEQSPASVVITDTAGKIMYANGRFTEMTGYTLAELVGANPKILKSGQTTDKEYKELWDTISSGQRWKGALLDKRKDGTHFWVRSNISPVLDSSGQVTHYLAIQEDITLDKIRSDGLERQAAHDYLTGLPNRLLAFDRLKHALSGMAREQKMVAILICDLDYFKHVNDTLGHDAGDQLLIQVSERLSALLRADDTVARLGGDEFIIILHNIKNVTDCDAIAMKIIDAFSEPFVLLPQEMFCTVSVGIAISPDDGEDPQVLLRNADTAMYVAKAEGRNTYRFFIDRMNQRAKERMSIVTHLRHAQEKSEFHLVYQPFVDIASGKVIGAEALMRWKSSDIGNVEPSRFIPLAEELGLIVPIGQWLLRAVCQQIRLWQTAGATVPRIAINISSRQFREPNFSQSVLNIMSDSDVTTNQIEFEITESILIGDCVHTVANLRELRQAGVHFSVDDFGTGYSSLSYLQRFSLNSLKIDRSFVTNLPDSGDAAILTKAIISMAQQLRMTVVAEGVETLEQLQFLKEAGCDIAQGYLFSRGVSPTEFIQVVLEIDSRLGGND